MQLKRKKIAGLLSVATCSLLCTPAQADKGEWDVDAAVLYYAEDNGRVQAIEPVISAKKDLGDEESLSLKLVIDSLTGSSPNGAVPSTQVQTFITPSGKSTYQVAPNETPLDPTFKDTRVAYSMNWEKPYDRNNRRNYGFNISKEYDFTSISANALWQHDANKKNTTYSYGFNLEFDEIEPVGGVPDPLTSMYDQMKGDSTDNRNVIDLLFGVTQIIDRTSLFQVNLTLSEADGYMTDPYKIVSVVDDVSGEPVDQLYENRPDSRSRQGLYGKYRKTLGNDDIFTASYRYMTDDWGDRFEHLRFHLPLQVQQWLLPAAASAPLRSDSGRLLCLLPGRRRPAAERGQRRLPSRRNGRHHGRHQVRARSRSATILVGATRTIRANRREFTLGGDRATTQPEPVPRRHRDYRAIKLRVYLLTGITLACQRHGGNIGRVNEMAGTAGIKTGERFTIYKTPRAALGRRISVHGEPL